jgi:hypothetical protein
MQLLHKARTEHNIDHICKNCEITSTCYKEISMMLDTSNVLAAIVVMYITTCKLCKDMRSSMRSHVNHKEVENEYHGCRGFCLIVLC